jgi:uncharacterized protein (DUF1800 family)
MAISTSDYRAAIAANRFGIGARPGDLASIKSDPQGWLFSQLRQGSPKSVPDSDNALGSTKKNLTGFFQNRGVRAAMRSGDSAKFDADIKKSGNLVQSVLAYSKPIYLAEVKARTQSALESEAPLLERHETGSRST